MSQLELSAWRFLAAHRVGALAVSHIQFVDGPQPFICAPDGPGTYESATGDTFGEAAIALARQLGMPDAT